MAIASAGTATAVAEMTASFGEAGLRASRHQVRPGAREFVSTLVTTTSQHRHGVNTCLVVRGTRLLLTKRLY
jgi:hypothetical protein